MQFSDVFKVDKDVISDYGAIDISLVCDIPLFVDPMLIFNSEKPEYQELHQNIIKYFHFLATKAQKELTEAEIRAWFCFHEVCENWLGFSLSGNKGSALSLNFGNFLYKNIGFVLNTNGISKQPHVEKIMLLYDGSGKDKISDMTVNLIKGYLAEYSQIFAKKFLSASMCDIFYVEKTKFDYKTESFTSEKFYLPFIINEKGKKEYVLLTPADILREDEPSINREDYFHKFERVRSSIDNEVLKAHVENYIAKAIIEYEEKQKEKDKKPTDAGIKKVEMQAFAELTLDYPELYDYYVRLREADSETIQIECMNEVNEQLIKLLNNARKMINIFVQNGYQAKEELTAQEESINRLKFFKHIIEDCDAYKNFYVGEKCIAKEADLQRMFKLVWYETTYKANFEVNNGRGPADVVVDKGSANQCIIEFKLASNSKLGHVFKQVKIYEAANCADGHVIAIFYFNEAEFSKACRVIKLAGYEEYVGKSIFLIDCRADNKASASIA